MLGTHDGSFVYYTLADDNGATGTLYKVSVLGGSPRKIVEHINTKASLSPDDSQVAFMRYGFKPGVSALITANANDGSDERVLESSDNGPALYNPEWSPDAFCGAATLSQMGGLLARREAATSRRAKSAD